MEHKSTSINQDFFVSARKSRTQNRSVYNIHEDSSTGLTPQSRKKTVKGGARKVVIYTDGACKGNPGPGGWGALLLFGAYEKELYGGEKQTTNNRMELRATIEALKSLTRTCEIKLYTDSTYVKNGIQTWMKKWKTNNWKTANKKPVKNKDLWEILDALSSQHSISWHWVKGHAGEPGNEHADALANRGIDQQIT